MRDGWFSVLYNPNGYPAPRTWPTGVGPWCWLMGPRDRRMSKFVAERKAAALRSSHGWIGQVVRIG